jgi:hypothetical protein
LPDRWNGAPRGAVSETGEKLARTALDDLTLDIGPLIGMTA